MMLKRIFCYGFLIGIGLLAFVQDADAITRRHKAQYGYTTSPFWDIGDYNKKLSSACQRRMFSQKKQYRYSISFIGVKGKTITGIATSRWNLYDPYHMAQPAMTYHFFNDGFSNCQVYTTQQPLTDG